MVAFASCKNNVEDQLNTKDSPKVDAVITVSADGMSGYPDEHSIQISSYSKDVNQQKSGMKSMKIANLSVPMVDNGESNRLETSKYKNTQFFKSGRTLFGKPLDINAILSGNENIKNARIQSQDFYSPDLVNLELSQENNSNVVGEIHRTDDLKIKWNVDTQNKGSVYVSLICKPDAGVAANTELKRIHKEVKDSDGEVIIGKEQLNSFPLGNNVAITIARGNQKDLKIDDKNIRIMSYNTSSKTTLIVKQ